MVDVLSGTGHRPEVIGGHDKVPLLVEYAKVIIPSYKPKRIISGMALGWDQAIALAALDLGIPVIAAVPFIGQEHVWPEESKRIYHEILSKVAEKVIVCEGGYASWKYIKRDAWMVEHGDAMLALWNGNEHGGTYNTVKIAEKKKKPVFNVWPGWVEFQEEAA